MISQLSPFGFLRVAACSPELRVADVEFNSAQIAAQIHEASARGVQLAVFPELCLTAYTCGDLFYQRSLQDRALRQISVIAQACREARVAAVVGLPVAVAGRLFNAACLIGADGKVVGLVPKTYLPNTNEFYEARWFTRGDNAKTDSVELPEGQVPFGCHLLFAAEDWPHLVLGLEICEDLWAIIPPSSYLAAAGASVIANPSASNEVLGKKDYREDLVRQQSARCLAAYAYASAGPGESSTDLVYSGHCLIAENGGILARSERFSFQSTMTVADVDLDKLAHERNRNSSFAQVTAGSEFRRIPFTIAARSDDKLLMEVDPRPFVPQDPSRRHEHCEEIFNIQATGLAKRLMHTRAKSLVLGLSGGLDSTLAALVASRACKISGLGNSAVVAVCMPGPGTTSRTKTNAEMLASALGFNRRDIPIHQAVAGHLRDIGHPEGLHDLVFENSQARERTQILMNVAQQTGGFVLGTGDLSETALGWCTYNGDHMSMYHVNSSVPKTLVRHLVEWCADTLFTGETASILRDICATPISPELLPASKGGEILQQTEQILGPYELHDFFLYHSVRHGFTKEKIARLAAAAFAASYPPHEISACLETFFRRFYSQQFKRSCMPDGPKVGSVALSPRGDWRMPSDAVVPS
jgi:NAD+ synthase (glutamine-hydrolysing)